VNKEDEICLILSSKHEGVEDAKSDLASLLIRYSLSLTCPVQSL